MRTRTSDSADGLTMVPAHRVTFEHKPDVMRFVRFDSGKIKIHWRPYSGEFKLPANEVLDYKPSDRGMLTLEEVQDAFNRAIEADVVLRMERAVDAQVSYFDPAQRAAEKQASRDQDEEDLRTGRKTQEQLRLENGRFAFPNVRVNYFAAKKLS